MVAERVLPEHIRPLSGVHIGWRSLHGLAVLYVVLAVPCRLAFDFDGGDGSRSIRSSHAEGGAESSVGTCDARDMACHATSVVLLLLQWMFALLPSAAALLDLFADLVFAADVVVGTRTSYIDDTSQVLITARTEMRTAYVERWWITDVLSVALPLPLDAVAAALGPGAAPRRDSGSMAQVLRHGAALLRLTRLTKLFAYLSEAETFFLCSSSRRKSVQLLRLAFSMFLLMHLTGCAWFMMGRLEGWPAGNGWLPPPALRAGAAGFRTRYLHACYWGFVALRGLGPGVSMPETDAEVVFMMFVMVAGLGLFAALVGSLTNMFSRGDVRFREFTEKVEQVDAYMVDAGLPDGLQQRVRACYEYQFAAGAASTSSDRRSPSR